MSGWMGFKSLRLEYYSNVDRPTKEMSHEEVLVALALMLFGTADAYEYKLQFTPPSGARESTLLGTPSPTPVASVV